MSGAEMQRHAYGPIAIAFKNDIRAYNLKPNALSRLESSIVRNSYSNKPIVSFPHTINPKEEANAPNG